MSKRMYVLISATFAAISCPSWSQIAGHGDDLSGVWTNDPEPDTRPFQNWALTGDLPPMTEWALERFEVSRPTFGPRSVPVLETNDPVYAC
ncbi:MAG: hypothetical protein OXQ89_06405, partial [Rhodospirillaceae bacterium]|nr:hypothetical protein [Rhodospirillaceae bacterium]